jgi:transcriptional regulator with XRE-family HTH domain
MPPRTNTLAEANRYLAWSRADAGRELRLARHNAGLTLEATGRRLGWSKTKLSRIERGRNPRVSLEDLVLIGSMVGVRPSIRFFPTVRPIRDEAQLQLLATLNRRMHPRWTHRQEVPMPRAGDLRAADQVSTIDGCRLMIEACTRFADAQAQIRAARAKQRDLGADRLLLLIEDTHTNRTAVLAAMPAVRPSFAVPARSMLAAIAGGRDPGGDGLLLLRRSRGAPVVAPRDTNRGRTSVHSPPVAPHATHGG